MLHSFTLTDALGNEHSYEVALHPATQGEPIMWALVALGVEPIAAALAKVDGAGGLLDLNLGDLNLTGSADALAKAIARADLPDLRQRILAHTTRDGRPLKDRPHFDAAYQGNYGELARALWEVVKLNRFLPLPAGLPTA